MVLQARQIVGDILLDWGISKKKTKKKKWYFNYPSTQPPRIEAL